jgi:hypothetical protein
MHMSRTLMFCNRATFKIYSEIGVLHVDLNHITYKIMMVVKYYHYYWTN